MTASLVVHAVLLFVLLRLAVAPPLGREPEIFPAAPLRSEVEEVHTVTASPSAPPVSTRAVASPPAPPAVTVPKIPAPTAPRATPVAPPSVARVVERSAPARRPDVTAPAVADLARPEDIAVASSGPVEPAFGAFIAPPLVTPAPEQPSAAPARTSAPRAATPGGGTIARQVPAGRPTTPLRPGTPPATVPDGILDVEPTDLRQPEWHDEPGVVPVVARANAAAPALVTERADVPRPTAARPAPPEATGRAADDFAARGWRVIEVPVTTSDPAPARPAGAGSPTSPGAVASKQPSLGAQDAVPLATTLSPIGQTPISAPSAETTRPAQPAPIELPPRTRRPTLPAITQEPVRPSPGDRRGPVSVSPSVAQTPGTPSGLGLGRLLVRLDGPRAKVTDREVETVAGTLIGGGAPSRLVLYVNGVAKEITPDGRKFQVAINLRPGVNDVRAVATDRQGTETVDAVSVEYVPTGGIAITSPHDGLTVDGDAPPVIVVEGRVDDRRVSTVWLVANQRRVPVKVDNGQFRHALVVLESAVRLWAESTPDGAPAQRSAPVTVHSTVPATMGVVVLDWPTGVNGTHVEMTATWRPSADRLDGTSAAVPLRTVTMPVNGGASEVFYLRNLRPGVYTFVLQYRAQAPSGGVVPTLWVPESGRLAARRLKPVTMDGAGRVVLAKVLLPHGVLWDQDDWFTGQSQNGDTLIKFRFPDGVSWVERKADGR